MSANEAVGDIEAIIARTALKYDQLPYQSKAFAQSQPARLAAIAQVFGLDAAALSSARVLELGCASGGNIIPLAVLHPGARFVGVDVGRTQVAAGRARIASLGLSNIEIRCESITDVDDELGTFDYIICHGVYSWVPPAVQEAILSVIRARMSPQGIACVSYNVLPGWRMLQPLRDAFLLEIPDEPDARARVAKARGLLDFLKDATPDKGPYGDMLRRWATRLATLSDDYIGHEFLEESNNPITVRAFAASAAGHGLGFLGECELATMIPDNYGAETARQVRARAGNDLVEIEQYLDLLTGRTFRQTLLVAKERLAGVNRTLGAESIAGLNFSTPAGMRLGRDGDGHTVTSASGQVLTTNSAAVAAGLARLVARFPSSSSLDECVGPDADADVRATTLDALYRMMLIGMVTLTSEPVRAGAVSGFPKALALACADAAAGAAATTNVRHETVGIDAATRILLPLLDGETGHAELAARLAEAAVAGKFGFMRDGANVVDEDQLGHAAKEYLQPLLAAIASAGLLEP